MTHYYQAILGSVLLCIYLDGCTPPPPPGEMRISDYHGPTPEMYMAEFRMTSRLDPTGFNGQEFSFFPREDSVIIVEPLLSDAVRSAKQKAIFLTTIGKWECAERVNPPVLSNFTYVKRCFRLVARTANGFTADTSLVFGTREGQSERVGELSVETNGTRCTAHFSNPRRNFANMPAFSPLTIVSEKCESVIAPKLTDQP
jgi:hypothetical protein